MAVQLSTTLRTAMAAVIETEVGTAPTLEIRTGAPPASCAAADTGTVLATMALPTDWLAAASGGAVALAGTWEDAAADATGTAGHFRIKQSSTCHMQGTVSQRTEDGGTGDLRLAQATAGIVAGQTVTITSFTTTIGGA